MYLKYLFKIWFCFQGQNPDGGGSDGDFMSEAKDWAGELISGQTGTGRILVNNFIKNNSICIESTFSKFDSRPKRNKKRSLACQ